MRQPEMSHSAAHHQGDNPLITAYFPDSIPAAPPAAHLTSDSPPLSPTQRHLHGVESSPPSDRDSGYDTLHPQPSDSHTQQYHHPSRRRSIPSPHQGSVDTGYPSSAEPIIVPETVVAASHLENGSLVTRASMTSEAVRKEGRGRGSWTDHSSYMSGDNHMNGAARVHKRAIVEDITPEEEEPDALLMLFRLSIPVPVFSFIASLYTVFGLLFVLLVSPLRLCSCIRYLRNTSFRAQLCDLLVPQLHIHERLVCLRRSSRRSASTQPIYDPEGSFLDEPIESYTIGGLISVLLLSPFFSIAILLPAWIAAFFWIFSMVMGNPDGTERKDDGRAAVLGVSRWWHLWLGKARKSPS
ncbi:uncharacterized protein BO95DRAFT_442759 [Aspergillus brunneoviolaceus CBS 621.78]|uniref:Uncharacterized protein n=1 Tax=Aspergillus brunneoviolaceus CBS 621.78 TaxID=1450534 RepID=A0ACD1G8M4_9EURO|nr:hypothetical protein BO95DRAFT_442759 [Aspergillus brunneoviolaceus CBS 621.78]RAH45644.1 hypothetical protein BO95DRAFT_442759 [Aspergillus brunneoviolaceus CBS 621.78]